MVGEGGDVDWLMTDAGGHGTTDVDNGGGDSSGGGGDGITDVVNGGDGDGIGNNGGKGKKRQKHQTNRRRKESTADSVINPSQISQSNDASSPSQISPSLRQKHSSNRRKLKESLYGKFNRAGGGNDHALRSSCYPIITRQIKRPMHSDHTCCPINSLPYPVSPSFVTHSVHSPPSTTLSPYPIGFSSSTDLLFITFNPSV